MFYCWHWCQSLTVSSVVGAPWRCGVLTTLGGIAGNGLGRLLGREHASTPQSGAEAPPLLKRSLPRLYCCCCSFFQKKKSEELTLEKIVQLKLSLFLRRRVDHPKWVVDFLLETTHSENKSWKSSRISQKQVTTTANPGNRPDFRVKPKTFEIFRDFTGSSFFFMFFIFSLFLFSLFFIFHFFFFFLFVFFFFFSFSSFFSVVRADAKNRKKIVEKFLLQKWRSSFVKIRFFGVGEQAKEVRKGPFEGDPAFKFLHLFLNFSLKKSFLKKSFKYIWLLALVSEFNCGCFLRRRDSWDWVGPPAGERAWFNFPEWRGDPSPVATEPSQTGYYCCCFWRDLTSTHCVCPHHATMRCNSVSRPIEQVARHLGVTLPSSPPLPALDDEELWVIEGSRKNSASRTPKKSTTPNDRWKLRHFNGHSVHRCGQRLSIALLRRKAKQPTPQICCLETCVHNRKLPVRVIGELEIWIFKPYWHQCELSRTWSGVDSTYFRNTHEFLVDTIVLLPFDWSCNGTDPPPTSAMIDTWDKVELVHQCLESDWPSSHTFHSSEQRCSPMMLSTLKVVTENK